MQIPVLIVAIIAALILIPAFFMFFVAIFVFIILFWAVGAKITITKNKVEIGYIRHFTFYPKK